MEIENKMKYAEADFGGFEDLPVPVVLPRWKRTLLRITGIILFPAIIVFSIFDLFQRRVDVASVPSQSVDRALVFFGFVCTGCEHGCCECRRCGDVCEYR